MLMKLSFATLVATMGWAAVASADSIDPTSYSATLAVGESVTIRKTVVVSEGGTSTALIDAHFLIDTSGSMGGVINTAKSGAAAILDALDDFGGLASSVGVFSEGAYIAPSGPVNGRSVNQNLSTNSATTQASIDDVTLCNPDCGGDYPESGNTAIDQATNELAWRSGSNRFMFVFSDAPMKGTADATVLASLAAEGVTVIGLGFGDECVSYEDCSFKKSILELGGLYYTSTTSIADIIADITAGITDTFAEYESVTVGDLGAGMPGISVSTVCVSADIGACVGADAVGEYDRTTDRTFEYDVTFTRLAAGDSVFDTHALVDGGIVASERDSFKDGSLPPVPLPAAGWMMLAGIGGLLAARRRKA